MNLIQLIGKVSKVLNRTQQRVTSDHTKVSKVSQIGPKFLSMAEPNPIIVQTKMLVPGLVLNTTGISSVFVKSLAPVRKLFFFFFGIFSDKQVFRNVSYSFMHKRVCSDFFLIFLNQQQVTEDELRKLFSTVGEVVTTKIGVDALTGNSRGFAFVRFSTPEEGNVSRF